jgi:predicted DNA-binding transcriptional regulator YafY
MSKQTYLNRYLFIIERLERGPATFDEIARHLEMKSESTGDDMTISQRTLQRDIRDIYLQIGYEIQNERKGDKRYKIVGRPEESDKSSRLMESYQLINIIDSSSKYNHIVFIESRRAKGMNNFHILLHAIINKLPLTFNYLKFTDDSDSIRTVHALALKEAIGRWYLVAVDTSDQTFKTFGLDRIDNVETGKKAYSEKYNYNIKELFKNAFGVVNDPNMEPERVRLAFSYNEGKYIKTYPLHHSQKIISEDKQKDELIIELFLVVAYDFVKEILSHGDKVKVIKPAWLKKEVRGIASRIAE